MDIVTLKKGTSTTIPQPLKSGDILFTTDTNLLFIDLLNEQSLQIERHLIKTAEMTGASDTAPGTSGIVPAPGIGSSERFLSSDGTWKVPSGGGGSTPVNTYLPLSGGTMTGPITWESGGLASINTNDTGGLNFTGSSFIFNNSVEISNIPDSYNDNTLVPKVYVDSQHNSILLNIHDIETNIESINNKLTMKPNFLSGIWGIGKLVTVAAEGSLIAEISKEDILKTNYTVQISISNTTGSSIICYDGPSTNNQVLYSGSETIINTSFIVTTGILTLSYPQSLSFTLTNQVEGIYECNIKLQGLTVFNVYENTSFSGTIDV